MVTMLSRRGGTGKGRQLWPWLSLPLTLSMVEARSRLIQIFSGKEYGGEGVTGMVVITMPLAAGEASCCCNEARDCCFSAHGRGPEWMVDTWVRAPLASELSRE
jgi:hypothetical protein